MELYALRETTSSMTDLDLHEVDIYYLDGILQKGKGCVRLLRASSSESEDPLAIKLFPKAKNGQCSPSFTNEERSVCNLSHPYLVKYHNFYNEALIKGKNEEFCPYSAIMMEYVASGDLFRLVSNGPLSEMITRTLFKQMVSVIEYLHSQKIAHLDLKLENFLINEDGIKLIDFDGCQNFQTKPTVALPAGTSGYRPPEFVVGGAQNLKAADVYSLGIVLFMMVTGTPPYSEIEEEGKKITFDKYYDALRNDIGKFWKVHEHYRASDCREPFSQEFKRLIEGMMQDNPEKRLTIDEIKRTRWYEGATCSKEELKRGLGC